MAELRLGNDVVIPQAYDPLRPFAVEVDAGKQLIANAINDKGGEASADESFSKLAQDVRDINESFITYGVEVTEKINWLKFICSSLAVDRLPLTGISSTDITSIRSYAFQSCSSLQTLDLPNLTSIGDYSFSSCSSLQTLDLPNLTSIGQCAFQSCSFLQNISLSRLNSLGQYAFDTCTNLQEVIFPNLTSIGQYAFIRNSSLRNVTFGRLTSNNIDPFYNSKPNLRNITIGQDTNVNLDFHNWTATNVIAEGQTGIDELNANLQTNLISKLYQGGNKILRLGTALYDVTTQETRDMVTAKGWTLQRG